VLVLGNLDAERRALFSVLSSVVLLGSGVPNAAWHVWRWDAWLTVVHAGCLLSESVSVAWTSCLTLLQTSRSLASLQVAGPWLCAQQAGMQTS
jgi:hypothetical protein